MATRKTRKLRPRIGRAAISVGAVAVAVGGVLFAILARGRRTYAASAEYAAPDLASDLPHPGPDPTAPVGAAEQESLHPPADFPSMTSH